MATHKSDKGRGEKPTGREQRSDSETKKRDRVVEHHDFSDPPPTKPGTFVSQTRPPPKPKGKS